MQPVPPPPSGILVVGRVAEALGVRVGDIVEVELVERDHRKVSVPVTGIIQSHLGLVAYMDIEALDRLVGDGRRISGVHVSLDALEKDDLFAAIKNTPALASSADRAVARALPGDDRAEHLMIQIVYTTLAVIIAFGVVYNSAASSSRSGRASWRACACSASPGRRSPACC